MSKFLFFTFLFYFYTTIPMQTSLPDNVYFHTLIINDLTAKEPFVYSFINEPKNEVHENVNKVIQHFTNGLPIDKSQLNAQLVNSFNEIPNNGPINYYLGILPGKTAEKDNTLLEQLNKKFLLSYFCLRNASERYEKLFQTVLKKIPHEDKTIFLGCESMSKGYFTSYRALKDGHIISIDENLCDTLELNNSHISMAMAMCLAGKPENKAFVDNNHITIARILKCSKKNAIEYLELEKALIKCRPLTKPKFIWEFCNMRDDQITQLKKTYSKYYKSQDYWITKLQEIYKN